MAESKEALCPLARKDVDFMSWQQTKMLEPIKDGGKLNESVCSGVLDEFLKLLQWYSQHKRTLEDAVVSQVLCYTDRVLEIFNDPSIYTQLQASKLLRSNRMKILRYVVEMSPSALDHTADILTSK